MKFIEYDLTDKNGKSNCVIRSLCKILNKNYNEVSNELVTIAKEINRDSYNDIPVFEKYMEDNGIIKIEYSNNSKIKDLKLESGSYIVFCSDGKDFYHMVAIIDNTVYDKRLESLDLSVISIYKKI